jgi:hypothetical protein
VVVVVVCLCVCGDVFGMLLGVVGSGLAVITAFTRGQ